MKIGLVKTCAKTTTRSELIPIAHIVKFTKKQKGRV